MNLLIFTQKVDRNDPILGFFHNWITDFASHCELVTVICLQKGDYDLPHNVKILSLGKENNVSRIKYIVNFYSYIWNERKNYDSVFVHMNQIYVILGGIIWRILGKRVSLWYMHKTVSISLRFAEKITNIIFSASKESFRLPSKKLIVTGHGIDTDIFKPKDRILHKGVVLTSVGRISRIKKLDIIISAISLLPAQIIDTITLRIVGEPINKKDKEYKRELGHLVDKLHLSSKVFIEEFITNDRLGSFLTECDININLSSTGSMDKAVLESMSSGVLTVSSNEAFRDVLSKYDLYIEKDDADSVAKIIESTIKRIGDIELKRTLRDYVINNHSLRNLIPTLVDKLTPNDTSR